MDDLLADPGVALGSAPLDDCRAAVAVLALPVGAGQSVARTLAREVLTAELNLGSGGETCAAIEATIELGQAQLARIDYDPAALFLTVPPDETEISLELAGILADYNAGLVCR